MKYSQIKAIKTFCESLTSSPDWREVVLNIVQGINDFEVDNVRFINANDIDSIQEEELSSDLYVLGCFNAWFLADVLEIDQDVIESMQEAEAFEAIGKLIISLDKLGELQAAYSSADGYGHHFNNYDSSEEELRLKDGTTFYAFDNR